jgi:hypothetical protein
MKSEKIWECSVIVPEQCLTFRVKAKDEESAISKIENYTKGKCIEVFEETIQIMNSNFIEEMKGILILVALISILALLLINFWKPIVILCSLSLIGFLFLSYDNITK